MKPFSTPLRHGLLALSLVFGATALSAQAATVEVEQAGGDTVTVPANPTKVAVFDPPTLDHLDLLGVTPAGIPEFKLPEYVTGFSADDATAIGTFFEPDAEAVAKVDPDLVFIGRRSGRNPDKFAALERPTVNMAITNSADLLKDLKRNLTTLGKIFDKSDEAQKLYDDLVVKVDALKAKSDGIEVVTLFAVGERMGIMQPQTRFGAFYDVFGFTYPEALKDRKVEGRFMETSPEDLVAINPDYIMVIDRNAVFDNPVGGVAKGMLEVPVIQDSRLGKENRIIYLDSFDWYLMDAASVRALSRTIDQVMEAIK